MLRVICTALAVTVTVLAPAGPAGAVTQACDPEAQAVVTKVLGGEWYMTGGFSGREHTFVCSGLGGQAVEIGQPGYESASSGGGLGPLVHHLAFADLAAAVVYENENGSRALDVLDLMAGRVRFHRGLGGGIGVLPGWHSSRGAHSVGAVVVKSDGSAAWTEQTRGARYDVLEHEGHRTVVLDGAGNARARSLTLAGSILRWTTSAGKPRRALLP